MSVYVLVPGPARQRLLGTGLLVAGFPPLLVSGAWSVFGDSEFPRSPVRGAPPHSKHLGEEMFSLGWLPLTGLPWNLPAVPGICAGPPATLDGTSSQAHQLAMSFNGAKCNLG